MRKLNDMYHLEGERLIKTSNGQSVPEDEPLFILRGRDNLSAITLIAYIRECKECGVPSDRISQLMDVLRRFITYRDTHQDKMKVPGSTHGR